MSCGQPAQLFVKAFRLEQRIGVCVTRGDWDHCFRIKVVNGEIPEKYHGDPQIMDAYKEVRAHYEKQQRKQSSPGSGDTALDSPPGPGDAVRTPVATSPAVARR